MLGKAVSTGPKIKEWLFYASIHGKPVVEVVYYNRDGSVELRNEVAVWQVGNKTPYESDGTRFRLADTVEETDVVDIQSYLVLGILDNDLVFAVDYAKTGDKLPETWSFGYFSDASLSVRNPVLSIITPQSAFINIVTRYE